MAGGTISTSTYVYELRRVGSKATCANVKDVFRLCNHHNIFGRNSEKVDYYLNSGIHKQLISRQHAELLVYKGEDGQPVFVIKDESMNGTFVNDVKLPKSKMVRIKEFDTITFGHVQGVSIKTGMYAEQPESEFRFVLEKVLINESEDNVHITDFPNFSTSPLYYHCTKSAKSEVESCLESKYTSCKMLADICSKRSPHTGISGSASIDVSGRVNRDMEKDDLDSSQKLFKRDLKLNVPKYTDPLLPCARSTILKTNHKMEHSQESVTHVCKLDNLGNGDCIEYHKNLKNQLRQDKKYTDTDSVGDGEILDVAAIAIQRATTVMDADSEPFSLDGDVSDLFHQKNSMRSSICDPLSSKPNISGDLIDVTQDAADVTIRYPVENQSLKKNKELPERPDAPMSSPIIKEQERKIKHPVQPKEQGLQRLASLKTLGNLQEKATLNHPLTQMSLNKLNKRASVVLSRNMELKKPRLGMYRNFSSTSTSEVYVPEECASIDCIRPIDNTISWVQCDDCDCWYHVTCMGCDYKRVKEPSSFFHCGCT